MSKTPRTDKIKMTALTERNYDKIECVPVELSYQLETELADKDKQLAEARAEIERKDALIEQMREALELMLEGAMHDFHYVCQHRDNCLCWACQKARIKAALAAERGE